MPFSTRIMQVHDWTGLRHFKQGEFQLPNRMGFEFMRWLDELRDACKFGFTVTSGARSLTHNAAVGGAKDSAHTDIPCDAVDLMPSNNLERFRIIEEAIKRGCYRIGIYPNGSIHLDLSTTRPLPRLWVHL